MEEKQKDFYKMYFYRYIEADPETRKKSFDYWMKKHAENMKKENRNDLYIFSGQILAQYTIAERFLQTHTTK